MVDANPNSTFDYFNPFVAAAINTTDGERYPLWTAEQLGADPNAAFVGSMAWLQQVQIEMQLGEVPMISATLTPPYRAGQAFLNSPLIEWGGSTLDVQFGYASGTGVVLSPTYSGILLKPEVSLGADFTITLKAQGTGGFSAIRSKSSRTFNNMTRFNILKEVAGGPRTVVGAAAEKILGTIEDAARFFRPDAVVVGAREAHTRDFNIDATAVENNSALRGLASTGNIIIGSLSAGLVSVDGTFANDLLFKEPINESQGNLSDWAFMQKVVADARCGMVLNGNTLVLFPLDAWMGAPPQRTFRMYDYPLGQTAPVDGVYPIISFSSDTVALYMPGSTRGIKMSGVNSETRQIENVAINDEEVKPTRSGKGPSSLPPSPNNPSLNAAGDGGGFYPGSPSDKRVQDAAKAQFVEDTHKLGINLEITSLVDPRLLPGCTIAVSGISKRHDAPNYGVTNVTWTIGTGGADMTFTCISNAALLTDSPIPVELDPSGLVNLFTSDDTPGGDDSETKAKDDGEHAWGKKDTPNSQQREQNRNAWGT